MWDSESLIRALAGQKTRDELDAEANNSPFPRMSREFELSLDSRVLDYWIRQSRKIKESEGL